MKHVAHQVSAADSIRLHSIPPSRPVGEPGSRRRECHTLSFSGRAGDDAWSVDIQLPSARANSIQLEHFGEDMARQGAHLALVTHLMRAGGTAAPKPSFAEAADRLAGMSYEERIHVGCPTWAVDLLAH